MKNVISIKLINEQLLIVAGKTRTKDKYRVVYTDHQRLELEKEFHYTRYITIRRKSELAQTLALSERQVKIWVSLIKLNSKITLNLINFSPSTVPKPTSQGPQTKEEDGFRCTNIS